MSETYSKEFIILKRAPGDNRPELSVRYDITSADRNGIVYASVAGATGPARTAVSIAPTSRSGVWDVVPYVNRNMIGGRASSYVSGAPPSSSARPRRAAYVETDSDPDMPGGRQGQRPYARPLKSVLKKTSRFDSVQPYDYESPPLAPRRRDRADSISPSILRPPLLLSRSGSVTAPKISWDRSEYPEESISPLDSASWSGRHRASRFYSTTRDISPPLYFGPSSDRGPLPRGLDIRGAADPRDRRLRARFDRSRHTRSQEPHVSGPRPSSRVWSNPEAFPDIKDWHNGYILDPAPGAVRRPPSNSYSYHHGDLPPRHGDVSIHNLGSFDAYGPIRDNDDEYGSYNNLGYRYGNGDIPPSRAAEISPASLPSTHINGGSGYAPINSNYNGIAPPIERLSLRGGPSKPHTLDLNKIPAPWKDPKAISPEHGTTEFLMIYAAEYYADGTESAITLQCESPALHQDITRSYEMVWLHMQRDSWSLKALEEIVMSCPYAAEDAKSVAVTMIRQGLPKLQKVSATGVFLQPGSVLRYDGEHVHLPEKGAISVTASSVPFLHLRPKRALSGKVREHDARTLLQFIYEYEVAEDRDNNQAVRKMSVSRSDELIHVPQLLSLLIGPDILITCGEASMAELQGGIVHIETRMTRHARGPCTVRIRESLGVKFGDFYIVVDSDVSYEDFRLHVVAKARFVDSRREVFELLDKELEVVTAETWPKVFSSRPEGMLSFLLRKRGDDHAQVNDTGFQPDATRKRSKKPRKEFAHRRRKEARSSKSSGSDGKMKQAMGYEGDISHSEIPLPLTAEALRRASRRSSSRSSSSSSWEISATSEGESASEVDRYPAPRSSRSSHHGSESGAARRFAANLSKLPPHHLEDGTRHIAKEMGEAMARMRGAGMIVNDMSSLARSVEQYDILSDDDTSGKRETKRTNGKGNPPRSGTQQDAPSSTGTESDEYGEDYSTGSEDEPSVNGSDIDEVDPSGVGYSSSDGAGERWRDVYADIMPWDSASSSTASRSSWAARRHPRDRPTPRRGRSRQRRSTFTAQSLSRKVRFSEHAEAAALASHTPSSVSLDSYTASPSVASSRPDRIPAADTPSSVSPLFAYCLGQSLLSASSGDDISNQTQTTFRLLTKVDKALLLDPTSGFLHKIRYESSLREVRDRHKCWLRLTADQPRTHDEDTLGEDENVEAAPGMHHHAQQPNDDMEEHLKHVDDANQPPPRTEYNSPKDPGLVPPEHQQQHGSHHKAAKAARNDCVQRTELVVRSIFIVSKKIMALFISLEIELVHPVLRRYWGSLDRICRHAYYSAHVHPDHDNAKWTVVTTNQVDQLIREEKEGPKVPPDCLQCAKGHQYDSTKDALNHLHEAHFPACKHEIYARYPDDPCIMRVKLMAPLTEQRRRTARLKRQLPVLEQFKADLTELYSLVRRIQRSLTGPRRTLLQSTPLRPSSRPPAPAADHVPILPSSLVEGFGHILTFQISIAQHLIASARSTASRPNEGGSSASRSYRGSNSASRSYGGDGSSRSYGGDGSSRSHRGGSSRSRVGSSSFSAAAGRPIGGSGDSSGHAMTTATFVTRSLAQSHASLNRASRDLMVLAAPASDAHGVSLAAVGPEYLLTVLLCNLQNRALQPSAAGNTARSRDDTDFLASHREYAAKLQYEAHRRPQRGLFFAINDLSEELSALRAVVAAQCRAVQGLTETLRPANFRVTTHTRAARFPLEARHLADQLRRLWARDAELAALQGRCAALKAQVGQSLAVLEEGHGKAIRVFTIVSVFFLPLSFVTGFLGMNTADLRNMDSSQTLFWAVAAPLTVTVVAAAWFYGYRWEAWEDRWRKSWENRRVGSRSATASEAWVGDGMQEVTARGRSPETGTNTLEKRKHRFILDTMGRGSFRRRRTVTPQSKKEGGEASKLGS